MVFVPAFLSLVNPFYLLTLKNVIFFIRFVLLMFGWTKNRYFTSNLLIGNPLGAFKDIQISAKSVGRTHHIKFSE